MIINAINILYENTNIFFIIGDVETYSTLILYKIGGRGIYEICKEIKG